MAATHLAVVAQVLNGREAVTGDGEHDGNEA
jgi:hypothetical protein